MHDLFLDRQHIFFEGKKLQDQLLLVGLVGQLQPSPQVESRVSPSPSGGGARQARLAASNAHRLGLIPPQATCVALFDWDGKIPVRRKFLVSLCAHEGLGYIFHSGSTDEKR
jgi:hypothetical protein